MMRYGLRMSLPLSGMVKKENMKQVRHFLGFDAYGRRSWKDPVCRYSIISRFLSALLEGSSTKVRAGNDELS